MKYLVSYDLNKQGQNYSGLTTRLKNGYAAKPILLSQWVTKNTSWNALQIRNDLKGYIDSNDRLLVSGLDGADWAGYNLSSNP